MSTYLYMMGWNEILARIFDGFKEQRNVSPPWLVNPATRRRLKLDLLYPEIGVAIRFAGIQAKGSRRKSDWEELEDESRDEVRRELCRLNGVDLILLLPYDAYPANQFRQISTTLGSASRRIATGGRFNGKASTMERLANARQQLDLARRKVNKTEDLVPYAELWRDRELQMVTESQRQARPNNGKSKSKSPRNFRVGQQVKHEHFGPGMITAVEPGDDDLYVTVQFVTEGERRFMASLLGGKMSVSRRA